MGPAMGITTIEQLLPVAVIAALTGGAAGAGAWLFLGSGPEVASTPRVAQDRNAPDTGDLEARLAALEQRVAGLDLAPVAAAPSPRVEDDRTDARLEAIERSLEELALRDEQRVERSDVVAQSLLEAIAQQPRIDPTAARDTILDPMATEADKLAAWRALRDAEEWGPGVVEEMIRVGESSTSEATRADVWRQADARASSDLLVPPLLNALAHDPSAPVRSEAAETLVNYTSVPGVLDALRHAAEFDADEEVREEARNSMRD